VRGIRCPLADGASRPAPMARSSGRNCARRHDSRFRAETPLRPSISGGVHGHVSRRNRGRRDRAHIYLIASHGRWCAPIGCLRLGRLPGRVLVRASFPAPALAGMEAHDRSDWTLPVLHVQGRGLSRRARRLPRLPRVRRGLAHALTKACCDEGLSRVIFGSLPAKSGPRTAGHSSGEAMTLAARLRLREGGYTRTMVRNRRDRLVGLATAG
jgi:hypothetical protein